MAGLTFLFCQGSGEVFLMRVVLFILFLYFFLNQSTLVFGENFLKPNFGKLFFAFHSLKFLSALPKVFDIYFIDSHLL